MSKTLVKPINKIITTTLKKLLFTVHFLCSVIDFFNDNVKKLHLNRINLSKFAFVVIKTKIRNVLNSICGEIRAVNIKTNECVSIY